MIWSGAQPFSWMLFISAPIMERGVMIRPMGRFWMEASPVRTAEKPWAARIPEMSRVVVPLFPQSRGTEGAERPWRPLPWTVTTPFLFSMSTPIWRKQEMVERQSAPSRKPWISVVPLAMEPSMTLRWEMDLSPGTVTEPRMLFAGESFMECLISI